jgi:hypothetical protein
MKTKRVEWKAVKKGDASRWEAFISPLMSREKAEKFAAKLSRDPSIWNIKVIKERCKDGHSST